MVELPLQDLLNDLHRKYKPMHDGTVAQSPPELATANPNWFGICIIDTNGQIYEVGDTSERFTIQSISKPFVYGRALEDRGVDYVLSKIGVEPTGDPFNSIVETDEISERRYNPMINAGAIAATSLIAGDNFQHRYDRLLETFRRYTGRQLDLCESSVSSRQNNNDLNRAMAYLMLHFDLIDGNIEEALELYCRQCSLLVNCRDLAMMAATLANAGVNPVTGERAIATEYVKNLLAVMYTCGLYDFAGQWAYRIGLPAKSGLAGSIIAVVPKQMGIAIFSPPLSEESHKSSRGVKVCEELSEQLKLHIFSRVLPEEPAQCPLYNAPRTGNSSGTMSARSPIPHKSSRPNNLANLDRAPQALNDTAHTPPPVTSEFEGSVSPFQKFLDDLYQKYLPLHEGKSYVSEPDLFKVNPDWFGICAVTADGQVYETGDSNLPFLIQSISKVFVYGLALEDRGREELLDKVDVEPTGDAYNSIIKVEERSKRPYNPMVNTGAIAMTSLIKGNGPARRLNRILEMYQRYVGHQVFVDMTTFVSEQTGGDRNWAISYLLRNFGLIEGDIRQTLELYLQQCSVIINCRDLAVMGATLANNGVNPMTGERAIDAIYVRDLLSVMYTCGMYDFAGTWVYNIGFPAKSGVGGGIVAVVPGQMGIAIYSPLLDKRGNSVRGIEVCKDLSRQFGLHIFEPLSSQGNLKERLRSGI